MNVMFEEGRQSPAAAHLNWLWHMNVCGEHFQATFLVDEALGLREMIGWIRGGV